MKKKEMAELFLEVGRRLDAVEVAKLTGKVRRGARKGERVDVDLRDAVRGMSVAMGFAFLIASGECELTETSDIIAALLEFYAEEHVAKDYEVDEIDEGGDGR